MDIKYINSKDLKIEDLPNINKNWRNIYEKNWYDISKFALTFDIRNELEERYHKKVWDLKNATLNSSISELRAHLYLQQRKWNHIGREPDFKTLKKIYDIIKSIGEKLDK